MRNSSAFAVTVLSMLAACQVRPPVETTSSLRVAPDLELLRPSDIAVLPIEDATRGATFEQWSDVLRQSVARSLVQRYYSPLANTMVDRALVARASSSRGSPVDASYVNGLSGVFEEDAILGVRVLEWDDRKIMQDQRARFAVDVMLVARDGNRVLWSGRLDGEVKAGGDGPAPLGRSARTRSAVELMAQVVIGELPARRP